LGCNDLAILFGTAVEHSLPLLERSCTLGLARGCANLGRELLWGQPSEAARKRAIGLLSRACEQSDGYGCDELGNALYDAEELGQKGSFGRAHAAYEKACTLGRAMGCLNDGWMLRRGEGTAKDPQRSRQLFRFTCDQQVYAGCAALGWDLLDDAHNPAEYAEGGRWSKLACEHDDAFGCFALGSAMAYGSDANLQSAREGLTLLQRACKLGFANGCSYAQNLEQDLKNAAAAPRPSPGTDAAAADDGDAEEED
jgi:TPR repeat protein